MLSIHNLRVTVDKKDVIKGVSLIVHPGEIHALMGPNGSGKTSLAMALAGHPKYAIAKDEGQRMKDKGNGRATSLSLDGVDITQRTPDERARLGLFLAMQYPVGVEGVTVEQLLRRSVQEIRNQPQKGSSEKLDVLQFRKDLEKLAKKVGVKPELLRRGINVGFSGGEKKRLEILQMLVLKPKYAILDETDSGLDIDALKKVAEMVKTAQWLNSYKPGILVITHYSRLLHYLKPDHVHIMKEGKITESGSKELGERIEKEGYK